MQVVDAVSVGVEHANAEPTDTRPDERVVEPCRGREEGEQRETGERPRDDHHHPEREKAEPVGQEQRQPDARAAVEQRE